MQRAKGGAHAAQEKEIDDGFAIEELPEIRHMAHTREQERAMPWNTSGSDLSFGARSSVIAQAVRGVNLRAV